MRFDHLRCFAAIKKIREFFRSRGEPLHLPVGPLKTAEIFRGCAGEVTLVERGPLGD